MRNTHRVWTLSGDTLTVDGKLPRLDPDTIPATLIFIDSRVPQAEELISKFGLSFPVVMLDSTQDGVQQVAAALAGLSGLDAIHIVSHGSEGTLNLGSTILDASTLAGYSSELAEISRSLTDTGDILIYGCNVAKGDLGLGFVESLAAATGADIAASTDLTGQPAVGGNWVLEASVGTIDVASLSVEGFDGLLASAKASGSNTGNAAFTSYNERRSTDIKISNAPLDAVISSVTVTWNVDANRIADIQWYINNQSGAWVSSAYSLSTTGNNLGDGYDQTSSSSRTLYPTASTPVNGTWWFNVTDKIDDANNYYDSGRLDEWSISISYTYT